jgi:hypothetical protein
MRLRLTLIALVCLDYTGPARANDAADGLLRLAPPDAGMALVIQDLAAHARRFLESPVSERLAALPAVRAWRESAQGQGLQQAKHQIARVTGKDIGTLRDELLGDAVVLVLRVGPDETPEQARGLLLARVRDPSLLGRLVQEVNSAQLRKGELARVAEKSWRGSRYSARVYADARRTTEFYATLDRTFAWSNSEALVQGVLERQAGGAPGLADAPGFRQVRDKLPRHAVLSAFLDGRFVQRSIAAGERPADPGVGALAQRYIAALDYAGATVEWDDGIVLQTEERLRTERLDPWIKAWAASATTRDARALDVPATAFAAARLHADFPAFLQAVESVVPERNRAGFTNVLDVMRGVLLGRDVGKEIAPYLGPGVLGYVEAPQRGDAATGLPAVLSVEVGETPHVGLALENGLRTLLALHALDDKTGGPGAALRLREVSGVRIWALDRASPFAFALANGRLVLGRSPEAVERAFAGGTNPSLTALRAAHFPAVNSFACADLTALKQVAEAHRAALVARLASRNHRPEETEARDLDHALALIGLFRAAYVTSTMAPDASSVHRTAGLIAREPSR